MMFLQRILSIIVLFLCGQIAILSWAEFCGFPWQKLPKTFIPTHYELELNPDLIENKFQGQVSISLTAGHVVVGREPTLFNHIIMHAAANLQIADVKVFQAQARNPKLPDVTQLQYKINEICHDDEYNLLVIRLDPSDRRLQNLGGKLNKLAHLIVRIDFSGSTRLNGQGLVRVSFDNPNLNLNQHVLYTRYDRLTGPSHVFPCFDDVTFRVDARLRMVRINMDQQVYSNTPVESSHTIESEPNFQTRIFNFKLNKSISIRQLGFAISRFIGTRVNNPKSGEVIVKLVITRKDLHKFSFIMLRQLYRLVRDFINVDLPIETLNIISVPGIGQAFETNMLGFVVADAQILGQNEYPEQEKAIEIASRIIRLYARQWIGNLVELEHEHQQWFFEAIIDWMVYFNMDKTSLEFNSNNEYKMYFSRNQMSKALELDSLVDATPLCPLLEGPLKNYDELISSQAGSSSESSSINLPETSGNDQFDSGYIFDPDNQTKRTKAIAIINLLEESCWGNFTGVIKKFVDRNQSGFGNLAEFIQMVNQACHWRPHAALKKLQALKNYPLVKLAYNSRTNTVMINQERFKHDYTMAEMDSERPTTTNESQKQLWILPITFTYGNYSTRWSRRSMLRIYDNFGEQQFQIRDLPENLPRDSNGQIRIQWVKANNAFKSFYRVLYSDALLKQLMKATIFQMSNLDCLQFVDDALALFRSGKVGAYYLITTLLGVSTRTDDLIHDLMTISFLELRSIFLELTPINDKLNSLALTLFGNHFLAHEYKISDNVSKYRFAQDIQARGAYYELLALLDYNQLVPKALDVFRSNSLPNVNLHLHSSIFTTIVRNGNNQDLMELMNIFALPKEGLSRQLDFKITRAFGMAKSPERLNFFWQTILASQKTYLISHYISSVLDTLEGHEFLRQIVLPQMGTFYRLIQQETLYQLMVKICTQIGEYPLCEQQYVLTQLVGPERVQQLQNEIMQKRRKRFYLQLLDDNKLDL